MIADGANGNGTRPLWWIITTLTGLSSMLFGHYVGHDSNAQRIAVLESQVPANQQRLERIEQKLDRIIEHEHKR